MYSRRLYHDRNHQEICRYGKRKGGSARRDIARRVLRVESLENRLMLSVVSSPPDLENVAPMIDAEVWSAGLSVYELEAGPIPIRFQGKVDGEVWPLAQHIMQVKEAPTGAARAFADHDFVKNQMARVSGDN